MDMFGRPTDDNGFVSQQLPAKSENMGGQQTASSNSWKASGLMRNEKMPNGMALSLTNVALAHSIPRTITSYTGIRRTAVVPGCPEVKMVLQRYSAKGFRVRL